ncbi:pseudouridine synthase rsua/rlub/c/d/e/f [Lucifera butyrica]|uniref:Pseudouridine synthase n=1 Tax=Lucifera butyrica TaxID=1351585 RepID=A0A498R5G8_9FIRM|nr:pseudouridine synthase [Lucifera butyrica]VBB07966.1 pseudouridine synthase rsua/rlub/c/d/e/f [Lucifera butyrica]
MERLQKIISQAGIASRREAENLIRQGRVSVNGTIVTELGTKASIEQDKIRVDNRLLKDEKYVYVLFYKPRGVVTTLSDPQGRKTVADFVADITERVYPVGRLDYNTEGLLLLTNDGRLAHGLTHPSRHVAKVYLTKVDGMPSEEKLDRLRAGIKLADGVTAPAQIHIRDRDKEKDITTLEITLHEGKNRQIRRMCEAIGHPVKYLKRIEFAFLSLAGLRRGQYRYLTASEIAELMKLIQR